MRGVEEQGGREVEEQGEGSVVNEWRRVLRERRGERKNGEVTEEDTEDEKDGDRR